MALVITTIGEVLVDLTQTFTDENGIANFAANPGGAPANVAVAASRLGARTAFIGCIGKDSFGDILRRTLADNNVCIDGLQQTDEASTTLAVVSVSKSGERSFSFIRKPGADMLIDSEKAIANVHGTGLLHFGSVSLTDPRCRAVIKEVVKAARGEGALITYDPNYRASLWVDVQEAVLRMREVLPLCDIIKISEEETLLLTGESEPEKAAQVLISQGLRLVLVTLGSEGAYFCTKDMHGTVEGCKVNVVDTNGAGDTFFGAFLSRIALRGGLDDIGLDEIRSFVAFANKAASLTTSRRGAIPAMPYLREVE